MALGSAIDTSKRGSGVGNFLSFRGGVAKMRVGYDDDEEEEEGGGGGGEGGRGRGGGH